MAASNFTAIRAAIVTLLGTVSGIGVIHNYQRMTDDWSAFKTLFKDPTDATLINGWMVSRFSTAENHLTNRQHERIHRFRIHGLYGVKDSDASEIDFDDLIEEICDTWRSDINLSGACERTMPVQVLSVDYRMFGPILCHSCQLEVEVHEVLLK